jgi:nitroimidazol reductase NimA-like FMN-containing flavoprotein (pyridoxamine 5'-phosphate oxidase superfamily)
MDRYNGCRNRQSRQEQPVSDGQVRESYPISQRNQVKRLHERGAYDHATVHRILDSAMLCHIAYVIDGQPYCTPTFFWREGTKLYWHGSSASRMLRNQSDGERVCVTVSHLDSLVLARCGFNHSADYRSVMAFGTARIVTDPNEKQRALVAMVDRLYPDRTAGLRQASPQEIKATTFIVMEIEEASAKVRSKGVGDDEEDYALPIYAERIPVRTVLGAPEPCPRLLDGVQRPGTLNGYSEGRLLEDALRDAHFLQYPNG